jgi:VIT1/CCC1 family predicted Fe2+/Mn2+ transporter
MIDPLPLARFSLSIVLTLVALFAIGASRALISGLRWWVAGLEMLALGAIVAAVAFASGAAVAGLIATS